MSILPGMQDLLGQRFARLPDFDQLWQKMANLPPGCQPDDGGKMYCFPAAALNWIVLLADQDPKRFPEFTFKIQQAPANWPYLAPTLATPDIPCALAKIADAVGTSGKNGTLPDDAQHGLQDWIGLNGAPYECTMTDFSEEQPQLTMTDVADRLQAGAMIIAEVGRWNRSNPPADPKGKFILDGTHFVALADASKDDAGWSIAITDSGRERSPADEAEQSMFSRDPYRVEELDGDFDPGDGAPIDGRLVQIREYPSSTQHQLPLIHHLIVIQPKMAATVQGDQIAVYTAAGLAAPRHHPTGGGAVRDLAFDPLSPSLYFIADGAHAVRRLDLVTGRVTPAPASFAALHGTPLRLAFGGLRGHLYIATDKEWYVHDRRGRQVGKQPFPPGFVPASIVFDNRNERFLALSGDGQLLVYDRRMPLFPPRLETFDLGLGGSGRWSVEVARGGDVVVHRDGDPLAGTRFFDFQLAPQAPPFPLPHGAALTNLRVGDDGSLFFIENGRVVQRGGRQAPFFGGASAQGLLALSHGWNTFDRRGLNLGAWRNVLPGR